MKLPYMEAHINSALEELENAIEALKREDFHTAAQEVELAKDNIYFAQQEKLGQGVQD